MLIMLSRSSRPRRFRPDIEEFFSMRRSHLSSVLDIVTEAFEQVGMIYIMNPRLFRDRIPYYAEKIHNKI